MNNKINKLKKRHMNIEMPKNFDEYIKKGIEEGKFEMRNKKRKTGWIKGIGAVAAIFTAFVVSINTMPVFAKTMSNVPGIGNLVKVLQFNKGTTSGETASGGTITDGADVSSVTSQKDEISETITINVSRENMQADKVPHFKVDYNKYPYTMTFSISGARNLSAEKYFDALKQNKFVSDVYGLITLDDSMVRFNVVFKEAVKFEVKEYSEPAQIVIKLTKNEEMAKEPVYSIRTASYPKGEAIGSLEEKFGFGTARIIKDEKGTFTVEIGTYDSENTAKEKLEELKKAYGSDVKLFIEKRTSSDIPKVIVE